MVELRDSLRLARNVKRMSQTEVAESIGVTQNTVSRWENGVSAPDARQLIKMGELYGVSLDALCGLRNL